MQKNNKKKVFLCTIYFFFQFLSTFCEIIFLGKMQFMGFLIMSLLLPFTFPKIFLRAMNALIFDKYSYRLNIVLLFSFLVTFFCFYIDIFVYFSLFSSHFIIDHFVPLSAYTFNLQINYFQC